MILATGASSRSGSAIVRRFARHHQPVRALTRNRARARALRGSPGSRSLKGICCTPRPWSPSPQPVHAGVLPRGEGHRGRGGDVPAHRRGGACPVDIEDIADVAYALLTREGHEGSRYEMTGPSRSTRYEKAGNAVSGPRYRKLLGVSSRVVTFVISRESTAAEVKL